MIHRYIFLFNSGFNIHMRIYCKLNSLRYLYQKRGWWSDHSLINYNKYNYSLLYSYRELKVIIIRFQAFLLICKRNSKSNFKSLHFLTRCAPGGGGVLRILSDGMIQGYFRPLKCCLIPGFFSWGGKIWQVFFGWYFYLSRDFFVLYQLMLSHIQQALVE